MKLKLSAMNPVYRQNCRSLITLLTMIFCLKINITSQTESGNSKFPNLLFPEFINGIVKMKSGEAYSAKLNYNMVTEEMIFDQQGAFMALLKPEIVDTVIIQGRKFIPVEKVFYEIVTTGLVSLFIQHKAKLVPVGTETAYGIKSPTLGTTGVMTMKAGNQVRDIELPDNVTVSVSVTDWIFRDGEWKNLTLRNSS